MTISKTKYCVYGSVTAVALSVTAIANAATLGSFDDTTVTVGGYVKLDAMLSDYSDGSMGTNIGRDFYVPSLTPVGANSQNQNVDFHARQTRFNLGTSTDLEGHTLKTFIEMDFMATAGGDERITNSYTPRLRHAFITYDKWLFGQTWTTFQNTAALPDTVDFIGNTDFGIFVRQPQIRYTTGAWQFSMENPESTILLNDTGAREITDDNELPDFVARYNISTDRLQLSIAGLARQLSYNDGNTIDTTETSYGLSVSGKYLIGEDDIRFGVNYGSGMGRYIGLNVSNGGVLNADNEIEAIDSTAFYLAYRHVWNTKMRSSITYSTIEIDNDTALTGLGATSMTDSIRLNFFYSPVSKLDLGFEVTQATRELESNADGSMTRFQFGAKLSF